MKALYSFAVLNLALLLTAFIREPVLFRLLHVDCLWAGLCSPPWEAIFNDYLNCFLQFSIPFNFNGFLFSSRFIQSVFLNFGLNIFLLIFFSMMLEI